MASTAWCVTTCPAASFCPFLVSVLHVKIRQYEAPCVLVIIRIFIYFVFYLYFVVCHPDLKGLVW